MRAPLTERRGVDRGLLSWRLHQDPPSCVGFGLWRRYWHLRRPVKSQLATEREPDPLVPTSVQKRACEGRVSRSQATRANGKRLTVRSNSARSFM